MSVLLDAIARQEGYGASPTNLATRNNNPGNLVYGRYAAGYGAVKDSSSPFAVFPDANTGYQAADSLLAGGSYSGLSIPDAIAKWNNHGSNTDSYVSNVLNWTGFDANTLVSEALGNDTNYDYGVIDNVPAMGRAEMVLAGLGVLAAVWLVFRA